jgi:hypothetical protein
VVWYLYLLTHRDNFTFAICTSAEDLINRTLNIIDTGVPAWFLRCVTHFHHFLFQQNFVLMT